jgi:hypothetical protein
VVQTSPNGNRAEGFQAPSGELAAQVLQDAQRLLSLEIALAKQEAKDLIKTNAIAAVMIGAGSLLLILAILVAVPSLVVVLVPWHWQAAAAWVVLYVLLGIALALVGKTRIRIGLPEKTVASLKENKEWALRRMKSTVR